MRTTLELDDDLILVGKRLADQRKTTLGRVVSDLLRLALTPGNEPRVKNGVPLFKVRAGATKPSLDLVNHLRDAE
jgi:hypothetical protein